MKIDANTVVTLHYRLTDDQGQLVEESFGAEPMQYLHGANNLIPGLERELDGKLAGDTLSATVAPADAYGEYEEALKQDVPMEAFGGIEDIVPGMRFMAETDQGPRPVVVTEVKDDSVVVDGNHPMAGQTLHFEVEIVEVREATDEERAHGHVHAGGGCCGGGCGSHDDEEHECCGGSGDCSKGDDCCGGHGHH
ncbi:peptidylprolyl isomerase FKBP-type [Ferrimonas balearica DSM 9799]|uniref:Peptidyl-prolyl cis-trans isomerase n=1 Tax=Ferrimonas balearica (strain DSM 9799 / CCM 4581 / KCTC 23876 / PAT) TaxID=550540 RepID=E1SSD4_FERBD|nr:peptidylprolyl isomerase [Ferrimonas balearica]ADN74974.1 peptidylprolyl isomerase FKBP-type [Ferrimonas balearica DSM 9799]MBY5981543.1 peptidylprolyl isomerase [Ferrimonas balearica]